MIIWQEAIKFGKGGGDKTQKSCLRSLKNWEEIFIFFQFYKLEKFGNIVEKNILMAFSYTVTGWKYILWLAIKLLGIQGD